VGDALTNGLDDTGSLVAENHGKAPTPAIGTVVNVHVRMADPGRRHLEQHLTGFRALKGHLLDREPARR
jgi:hypothetical protein|tara:strand:- start:457 stop:663 length:207 start_codon:yes stop_codon:yes gene_type:complete